MKKLTICILLATIAVALSSCGNAPKETTEKAPNIIYIFPDQYRQFSLGFWSQGDNAKYIQGAPDPVNTPTLDKFANEGIVFSRAMSNFPLCSPHRGMLLTGTYPHKNGLTANCHRSRKVGIVKDGNSIADVLGSVGYETAYFGKCHWQRTEPLFDKNGTYQGTTEVPGGEFINPYDTYVPADESRLGYDYFFQLLRDTHMDPLCYSNDPVNVNGKKDGELYEPKQFSAKLEAEAIVDYLHNTRDQRDINKPFFITWAMNPPHNPWTEEHTDMRFYDQYTENGSANLDKLLTRRNAIQQEGDYAAFYFANVSAVDFYVGKVLEELKKMEMDENTIIVFSSDHGEMLGSHGKQGKLHPEIEGFNIPFIIKWGNKLQHRVEDLILSVPDIMPTLLGLVGLEDQIPETVQGRDFSSVILDKDAAVARPENALFIDYKSRGLYTGKYTFVVREDKGKFKTAWMFDNEKDPYQLDSIFYDKIQPELLSKFKSDLNEILVEIEDPWLNNESCMSFIAGAE